ncbi:MAG: NAD-binding protein [Acidiferrobacterales bacterium]|nr:NAD-binding protein [Acidiferrobacterales bacterium]
MSDIFFLVLRKLRTPLIVLISVYAIATLGMTLIPGVDDQGQVWHMSFFHALYFVSFMGTTIGFGEIPYEFTDGQRAWVLVCIYTSVISWLYAIGTTLSLLGDQTFRNAISNRAFQRAIKHIDLPFYIICGYGETGAMISKGLAELDIQTVIIDQNPEQTNSLELLDLSLPPIVLTADTTHPNNLLNAGMNHPNCHGVIAVTEKDHTNLQIALNCKLLNKTIPVICRSEIEDEADNMASISTDTIINPFITFAQHLNLLASRPALHKLHTWFINQHHLTRITERRPPKGRWIVCGYGRLGKAIHQYMDSDEIEIIVVDPNPTENDAPPGTIVGRGTEADTLFEAGILDASVIIAASDDDANNLSTLITAEELNANIYSIGRVSDGSNEMLFAQANCDYVMRGSKVIANQALTQISRPLVTKFIELSNHISEEEAEKLIDRIEQISDESGPITWRLSINNKYAPALVEHLNNDKSLTIEQLSQHPNFPRATSIPLLLQQKNKQHLIPKQTMNVNVGDQLLLCGPRNNTLLPQHLRDNTELVDSLINHNRSHIPLLRWLARRKQDLKN